MKYILVFIFSVLIKLSCLGQADSVYLSNQSILFSEFEMIIPKGDVAYKGKYSYFKSRYWLHGVDTISIDKMREYISQTKSKKSRKKGDFKAYSICDSTINEIRNSVQYWRMKSDVDDIAKSEIGYSNDQFSSFEQIQEKSFPDFHSLCCDDYAKELNGLKEGLLQEIQSIKAEKMNRLQQIESSPQSLSKNDINEFIKTFDHCKTDFQILEIIITNRPNSFLNVIERMKESDYFSFYLNLNDFPIGTNIEKMKSQLKQTDFRSKRKRKVIRKLGVRRD